MYFAFIAYIQKEISAIADIDFFYSLRFLNILWRSNIIILLIFIY